MTMKRGFVTTLRFPLLSHVPKDCWEDMSDGNVMEWYGRIPLFRLIGETVLLIGGFFAAGSPADLFACLE